jgi:hypothetical protein
MSDRGTAAAESNSKPRWPATHMCTGEGKDRDPQQVITWFPAVANYINNYGMKETDPNAHQYHGVYCSNCTGNLFEMFSTNTPDDRKAITDIKRCFETCFLPSTSSDDIWYEWEFTKQTQDSTVQPITEGIIKLKNLQCSLPRNMILAITMR